jgi:C-terminal processing protease CtpA/Prc
VLVGLDTASFGEIFAGVLRDIGRAAVIGETTDGNVEILSVFNFSDGSRAWIAQQTFRPLNNPDQDWELSGIIPDIMAASSWDQYGLEEDPAVVEALKYFDG